MAACYCVSSVFLVLLFYFATVVQGSALLQQSKAEEALFPSSPLNIPSVNPPVNATSTLSEKIANITETGFQKLSSGVTSIINNISNVFNRTQDTEILGTACSSDANCSSVSDATCDKGMCNCGINFTVANNKPDRCLRVVKLGAACEEDVQCSKGTYGAVCFESHCVCSDLYTEEGGRCMPKRKLGSPCKVRDDCAQMPFADCNVDGVCACPKPFISSTYNNACLIMASPAGNPPCQEDKQCVATYGNRTACIDGICTCDHDYHPYNGKCLPDLKLGDTCNMPYDCIVSKFTEDLSVRECYNRTCICKPGYQQISDNQCSTGYGYQLQASLAWLFCIFFVPYLL